MKKITIAIDGYSSCGKSTMAKDLARSIGYVYIDTGAMYRAVTLYAMRHGIIHSGSIDADRLKEEMGSPRWLSCALPWYANSKPWAEKKVLSWTEGISALQCFLTRN